MGKRPYSSWALTIPSLAVLFCCVFCLQASAAMQVFTLQHQPAGALAEMVRALVGPEARVAVHENTLVVNAGPAELADIALLVESYDRVQRMLRVTVEQDRNDQNQDREINTVARLHNGSIRVGVGERNHGEDSSQRGDTQGDQVNIQALDSTLREKRQVSQFISVLEGSPARISVGHSVPFTSVMRTYCRRHPGYVETTSYQAVDTGFEVLPRLFGDMVQLDIRPFMAFLDERNPRQIVFQELSSQVRIPVGAWYDFSGQENVQNGLNREILGLGSTSVENHYSIRLRVDPE